MTARSLRTTAFASREELADALQCLFVSEVLVPSRPLWIVTPWISDVPIIDNRTGRFAGLIPALPQRWIRLGEILEELQSRGGSLVIACRPNDHNRSFTDQLQRRIRETGGEQRVRVRLSAELHEKGILTETVLLSGSMNLTYNGLRVLEEVIHLTDESDPVARARVAYQDRWGSP